MIILFGAGFNYLYFIKMNSLIPVPTELAMHIKIISDLALYSCSGAGGGLIATHADKHTVENLSENKEIIKQVCVHKESKQQVNILDQKVSNLEKDVTRNQYIIMALLTIILVAIVI